MLVREIKGPRKGYYLIKGRVKSEKEICNARVLILYPDGKEEALTLPVSKGGNINHIIKVPKRARLLRIEVPLSENTRVSKEVKVRRLNFLERLYRFYRRTLPLIFSRNPITKRLKKASGLSLFDILFRPEHSYYRVSYARYRRICGYRDYPEWLEEYLEKEDEFLRRAKKDYKVSFLIVVLSESSPELLRKTLSSVAGQVYSNSRIVVVKGREVGKVLGESEEDYVIFLEEGDILSRSALLCFARKIESEGYPEVIYGDNDFINDKGERVGPWFKPSWSPDYFLEFDYVQAPVAFRRDVVKDLKEFTTNYEIILKILKSEKGPRILNIPALLMTKRRRETKDEEKRKLKAVRDFLNGKAEVSEGPLPGTRRIVYKVESFPKVSVIIPTKDSYKLISRCLESLLGKTDYPDYEVILIDNGSTDEKVKAFYQDLEKEGRVRILHRNIPFNFSKLINFGVRNSKGEVLCLLNNDTEVTDPDWLKEMVRHAVRKEVGIVGAKLLYTNGVVQHGGVVMGIWNGTDHAFKGVHSKSEGYMRRLITTHNYLAVTAACMVLRREVFEEVGGFDERLAVNFNDVDFCLKVYEKGYRIIWTPYAELIHSESHTRGDNPSLAEKEMKIFKKKWKKYIDKDPFYNPNLTIYRTDFSLSGEVVFYCNYTKE